MAQPCAAPPAPQLAVVQPSSSLTELVNQSFRNYHSILALSRSPLAASLLVAPALVRDAVSPTVDERGHALRLVLRWAVELLAPEPPQYPLDTPRPYDDPAWRDPRWWRYNILRHRYIEPLHPDEFVEGGRYTETLIALTGIPSADSFFEERSRAIREVAAWLRQLMAGGAASESLQQLALEETLRPLGRQTAARAVLDIAATFVGVFPRVLLLEIAHDERIAGVDAAVSLLVSQRLLRTDEPASDMWLSPAIQAHLYGRQPADVLRQRHRWAARHYAGLGDAISAAGHWQRAGQWPEAAQTLLSAAADLINELELADLREALARFQPHHLPPEPWCRVQLLLCDLAVRLGQREEALTACRRALKATRVPQQQAPIYRRMGKLYEQHNQRLALGYYQQAEERFPAGAPELVTLLKDRAWLHILRREWQAAEADLNLALSRAGEGLAEARADIQDALASLNREQGRYECAVRWARAALALREELGNLPRIADSFNNLGLLYSALGDYPNALAAFDEALTTYRSLGNRERVAVALLNSGMAHHLAERRSAAVLAYRECLSICAAQGLRLIAVRACYNLAEATAELGEDAQAQLYWREGYERSLAAGFDDELRVLESLRERFPALQTLQLLPTPPSADACDGPAVDTDEQRALALAARTGKVTTKTLMAETHISKATATRRLAGLVQKGYLRPIGRGRATSYQLVADYPLDAGAAGAGAAPTLDQQLREHRAWLRASFGVIAIVPCGAPAHGETPQLQVRFGQQPDLRTFFEVERRLCALLGRRVDLLPAE